ncbi:MAG: protein kinase [Bacteroidales bacterium]|nr:protein kinase [Bacteroidales bacterium]
MSNLPQIPNYKVVRLIQEGGFSAVYEAEDVRAGRKVAIKSLFADKAKDEYVLNSFKQEAQQYLYLNHESIPRLIDFVDAGNRKYLVMEFVEGVDLNKFLRTYGPLGDKMTGSFFSRILDTLTYLHEQQVLHLDIKPSNIMLTTKGEIKILDLGIAAVKRDMEKNRKRCGSPTFMAPEQINGEPMGFYTDIYQTGVTLFNMVTGELPFRGSSQKEIFENVCNQPIPQLCEVNIEANEALQPVIDKAMHKDPSQRYTSCEEFKKELLEALNTKKREVKPKKEESMEEETYKEMKIITVGRDMGCDVPIAGDAQVSRCHIQLIRDMAGVFFVRDMNSTNGTFVNGQRIKGERQLNSDDVIRIGNTTLPWLKYFEDADETECIEEEKTSKKKHRRRKKTEEEKQANKEKMKKSLGGIGKWVLRIVSSVATMAATGYVMYLIGRK